MSPVSSQAVRTVALCLCIAFSLVCSAPLWWPHGGLGSYDWGFMQNSWQVRWQTLKDYGQWPGHNPWQGGGLPVGQSYGYFSISAVTTFLLGPALGLKVMIIAYQVIGTVGFWRLGRDIFGGNSLARVLLTALGSVSPPLAFHLAAGHLIFANLLVWPLILSYLLAARSDPWSGLKAGLLFALGFNEAPLYIMQYGGIICAIGWLLQFVRSDQVGRQSLKRFSILGIASAVPFMIVQTVGIVVIARDYARVANTPMSFSAAELFRWYAQPVTEFKDAVFVPAAHGWWGTWEMNCYLGWGAIAFFLFGLIQRPRWFHAAAVTCLLFSLGNQHPWEPMRWLMATPLFASLQSFARLRLFTYLFFSIGAAWGWVQAGQKLETQSRARWAKGLLIVAGLLTVLDVARVSHSIAGQSHFPHEPAPVANQNGGRFYQTATRAGLPAVFEGWPADLPLYTQKNIGVVRELAAIDSNFRFPTLVKVKEDPSYLGEFVQNGHAVEPSFWSPNRITFEHLVPGAPLAVNLNRGSPWHNFGRPLFPQDRIVEFQKPFVVLADDQGRVDLTYRPPGQRIAWWSTLAAAGLSGAFCLYLRKRAFNPMKPPSGA